MALLRRRLQFLPDRNSRDGKAATEICLNEDTHHKSALFFRQMARTRADPAFPSEGNRALARPDRALFDRSGAGFLQGALDVFRLDLKTADVVELPVICFADQRVHAADIFITRKSKDPIGQGCGCVPHAESVCQHNGCLDLPDFVDLRGAHKFAKRVVSENCTRDFLLKDIARVRQDRGDTGANALTLGDRNLADLHAPYVRDAVSRSGIIDARADSQLTGSRPVFRGVRRILRSEALGPERADK